MKWFKRPGAVVFLLCIVSKIASQPVSNSDDLSKIYVKVYGAYGFLTPGSYRGHSDISTNEPVTFHVPKTGMGAGIRAGAGLGIIINEFINLGMDGEYLAGNKIKLHENLTSAQSKAIGASGYTLDAYRNYGNEVVSIIPNIMFKAISKPNYYIYNRLGLLIGIPMNFSEEFYQHYHYINTGPNDPHTVHERDLVVTYNGMNNLKIAVGYQFSIGTQFRLSERLRGFFEITAYSVSFNRDNYEDKDRLRLQTDTNKDESPQPLVVDHSKYIYQYINSGATGTSIRGVPFNQITTIKYAQEPIIMNAITAGFGLAYRF